MDNIIQIDTEMICETAQQLIEESMTHSISNVPIPIISKRELYLLEPTVM